MQDLDIGVGPPVDPVDGLQELLVRDRELDHLLPGQGLEHRRGDLLAPFQQLVAGSIGDRRRDLGSDQEIVDLLVALLRENPHLILDVFLQTGHFAGLDLLRPLVLLHSLAGEDLHIHHGALDTRGHLEAGVSYVTRLLTKDRSQELFLGGQLGLALGRYLADQDVAGCHGGADTDDAAVVQILEGRLGDIGNVPRNLLGTQLGVPGLDLELLDVDRGEEVLFDQLLRD